VLLEVERRGLAGAQEVRDVLHLDEGHGRLFELDAGGPDGEVDESAHVSLDSRNASRQPDSLAQGDAILQTLEKVIAWQALVEDALDPLPGLVGSARGVLVEAQLAQVSIQRRHRRHGGRQSADEVLCVQG